MLKFEELHIGFHSSKRQKERLLFEANNFQFKQGEFIAVIGENGSGKTTLFNTILGLTPILSGKIIIDEVDLNGIDKKEKAKRVSFVPSKFFGVNHLTVYELIAMGRAPYTNIIGQLGPKDKEIVSKILSQLGLESLASENTINLSDGERQIAMIGKALAQEADVIILDEPTAFLDYNNRRKILKLLKDITENENKLVFLSSHDLSLCFDYCNRIVAIDATSKKLKNFTAPFEEKKIIEQIFR